MLGVVEHEQEPLARELGCERVDKLARLFVDLQHLRDRGENDARVAERCERDPEDAIRVRVGCLRCCLEGQPRLACPAGAGKRE